MVVSVCHETSRAFERGTPSQVVHLALWRVRVVPGKITGNTEAGMIPRNQLNGRDMSLCFNLNGTQMLLSDEILNSETSINFWKEVFKRQSDPAHYERFLRIIESKKKEGSTSD